MSRSVPDAGLRAQLTHRESLRDIETSPRAMQPKLYHIGFRGAIRLGLELTNTVYALDATTIDLCLSLFPWATFCQHKVVIKLRTLPDLRGSIPSVVEITTGSVHEINMLDVLLVESGAIYIMDRGPKRCPGPASARPP